MATSKLTTLGLERTEAELKTLSQDSLSWLKTKISEIRRPSSISSTLRGEKSRQTNRLMLGYMYCFYYDPKGKADLPYYDRFPMVLVIDRYNDGFLGLNLHYLPYRYRVAFLSKLMKFATLNENDEVQRLRVTYDILQASRRLKEFRPCIKRYLTSHINSKLLAIQPNEWDIAALLPLHQFHGATANKVWQESTDEIRK